MQLFKIRFCAIKKQLSVTLSVLRKTRGDTQFASTLFAPKKLEIIADVTIHSILLQYVFDYHPGDVFGCVADIGWVTGHSYVVYGPLCNGATTLLFESTPVYPTPGRTSQ